MKHQIDMCALERMEKTITIAIIMSTIVVVIVTINAIQEKQSESNVYPG